jgi:FixJ family two-component response regulator
MLSAGEQSHGSAHARTSTDTPLVFIVDDDVSMRESVESLVRCAGWHCETFASAEEFLARPRAGVPSCLVLDYRLPQLDGLGLQKRLAAERARLPIIFMTYFGDPAMAVEAMKGGALELLVKPFCDDALLAAIHQGIARSAAALRRDAELRRLWHCYDSLSRRERQIMALVVAGRLNKQIASQLVISEITVKAHRGHVMHKMQADSLAQLVNMAIKLNLESMPVP